MIKILLSVAALITSIVLIEKFKPMSLKTSMHEVETNNISYKDKIIEPKSNLSKFLIKEAPMMHADVVDKVEKVMNCVDINQIPHQNILTIIDYSLPSSQKRLWVFDLTQQRLLYHTYVSHGLNSGEKFTTYFSNLNNSRASSLGIYQTLQNYLGREGSSLRLKGLEPGVNDNAEGRAIVMHGAFYTEENFIKKYGRAGRSWGCPALPASQTREIVNAIKNGNILIVYYPSEKWLSKSKYLSCNQYNPIPVSQINLTDPILPKDINTSTREEVLFLNGLSRHYGAETPPILAMPADYYLQRINNKAPLNRMLRRQISHQEYIALSTRELNKLAISYTQLDLENLYFIIPTLTSNHGYVQTVMKPIHLGKVKEIHANPYYLKLNNDQHIGLSPNSKFIRWLGL